MSGLADGSSDCFRMANLSYIRNFCFSNSSKDELSYCLSTFEAAVEYINLGKLQDSVSAPTHTTHTAAASQRLNGLVSPPGFG